MKKEHRIAFRSVLELLALGGIKVNTALRRIYAITEIIEAGKSTKIESFIPVSLPSTHRQDPSYYVMSGLGRCTRGGVPLTSGGG